MKYLTIVMLINLTACGGGGSSGGGGGGAAVASNAFAGSYTGTELVTMSAPGLPNFSEEFPLLINILGTGAVTVTDVDGVEYTGQIDGSAFSASGSQDGFTLEDLPEASCLIEGVYTGNVSQGSITGTAVGTTSCDVGSLTVSISWEATFDVSSAPTAGATRSKSGNSRVREMVRAIQEGNR